MKMGSVTEWKLIGSCAESLQSYLLSIPILGFTFAMELFLRPFKRGYLG